MNIDKKLELAQEYAIEMAKQGISLRSCKELGWKYADAMEAEYNKRKQAESEQNAKQSKILFEQLTKNKDGSCAHFHTTLNKTECFDCGSKLQDEFQVDWSVAPEWAKYWHYNSYHSAYWVDSKPENRGDTAWSFDFLNKRAAEAPSFNYQGDWKDSLRKRP